MSQHNNKMKKNKTVKVNTKKNSDANGGTTKEVIHNIFVDTLEQPTNLPISKSSTIVKPT